MAASTSSVGREAGVTQYLMPVWAACVPANAYDPRRNNMAGGARDARFTRRLGGFKSGVGARGVAFSAKWEGLGRIGVEKILVLPSSMMKRALPFCRNLGVASSARGVLGQSDARHRLKRSPRRRPWKRQIKRKAAPRPENRGANKPKKEHARGWQRTQA